MRQLKERYDSIPEEVQMPDGSTVDKDTAYDTTIEDGAGKKYEEKRYSIIEIRRDD